MKMRTLAWLAGAALLFIAVAGNVSAQSTPLLIEFVPAPVAGQPFQIRVTNQTPCDLIQENAPVSVPRFVQAGNVVRLTTEGNQSSSPFCLDPLRTVIFNAPAFSAGDYTLELHYQHPTIVPPFLYVRQSVPLTVSLGSPGAPVPLGGAALWLVMVVSLGALALWRLRHR